MVKSSRLGGGLGGVAESLETEGLPRETGDGAEADDGEQAELVAAQGEERDDRGDGDEGIEGILPSDDYTRAAARYPQDIAVGASLSCTGLCTEPPRIAYCRECEAKMGSALE